MKKIKIQRRERRRIKREKKSSEYKLCANDRNMKMGTKPKLEGGNRERKYDNRTKCQANEKKVS